MVKIPQDQLEQLIYTQLEMHNSWCARLIFEIFRIGGSEIPESFKPKAEDTEKLARAQAKTIATHLLAGDLELIKEDDYGPMIDMMIDSQLKATGIQPDSLLFALAKPALLPSMKAALEIGIATNPNKEETEKWLAAVRACAAKKHQAGLKILETEGGRAEVWRQCFTKDEFVEYFLDRVDTSIQMRLVLNPAFFIKLQEGLESWVKNELPEADTKASDIFAQTSLFLHLWLNKEAEAVYG